MIVVNEGLETARHPSSLLEVPVACDGHVIMRGRIDHFQFPWDDAHRQDQDHLADVPAILPSALMIAIYDAEVEYGFRAQQGMMSSIRPSKRTSS